jgi:hypothetical protein
MRSATFITSWTSVKILKKESLLIEHKKKLIMSSRKLMPFFSWAFFRDSQGVPQII